MFQTWVVAVIGIWTIIVPFFGGTRAFYTWENFGAGIVASILSFSLSNSQPFIATLGVISSFWLIVSSYIPALQVGAGVYWNNIITGIIITIIGLGGGISQLIKKTPQEYYQKRLKPIN